MRKISIITLLICLTLNIYSQRLTTVVEGLLEVYDPEDMTSIYLGSESGLKVNTNFSRQNTFLGSFAGRDDSTGANNSFFGYIAGAKTTIGDHNSFFGSSAGPFNTEGEENSFFGTQTGYSNETGSSNSLYGAQAGFSIDTGSYNSFFGNQAGYDNKGSENSYFGYLSGSNNTTGMENAFFGAHAGSFSGDRNTYLGNKAGTKLRGSNNVCIGYFTGPNDPETFDNRLYIDNANTSKPLLYGEFDNDLLQINGTLMLGDQNFPGGGGNDDGIIHSSEKPGSDIFVAANDAVIIEISDTASEVGTFEVWNNSNSDKLLILDENGDLDLKGTVGMISDINRKEAIIPVQADKILEKVKLMPISEWQYIGNGSRHMGPMAQDFHAAFGLGKSDTRITTIDADGVALAAIQALAEENDHLRKEQVFLKETISKLLDRVSRLEITKK